MIDEPLPFGRHQRLGRGEHLEPFGVAAHAKLHEALHLVVGGVGVLVLDEHARLLEQQQVAGGHHEDSAGVDVGGRVDLPGYRVRVALVGEAVGMRSRQTDQDQPLRHGRLVLAVVALGLQVARLRAFLLLGGAQGGIQVSQGIEVHPGVAGLPRHVGLRAHPKHRRAGHLGQFLVVQEKLGGPQPPGDGAGAHAVGDLGRVVAQRVHGMGANPGQLLVEQLDERAGALGAGRDGFHRWALS
ncbi:hypothetical protein D3C72_1339400 [compost metagenome]